MIHLRKIVQRFKLRHQKRKVSIWMHDIKFIEHIISVEDITMDPENIKNS